MREKLAFLPNASAELRLLAWLCASGLSCAPVPPVSLAAVDWARFLELARHHRIAPVVWRNLSQQPDLAVPSFVRRDLAEQHRSNALHCMRTAGHLMRIAEALAGAG